MILKYPRVNFHTKGYENGISCPYSLVAYSIDYHNAVPSSNLGEGEMVSVVGRS